MGWTGTPNSLVFCSVAATITRSACGILTSLISCHLPSTLLWSGTLTLKWSRMSLGTNLTWMSLQVSVTTKNWRFGISVNNRSARVSRLTLLKSWVWITRPSMRTYWWRGVWIEVWQCGILETQRQNCLVWGSTRTTWTRLNSVVKPATWSPQPHQIDV